MGGLSVAQVIARETLRRSMKPTASDKRRLRALVLGDTERIGGWYLDDVGVSDCAVSVDYAQMLEHTPCGDGFCDWDAVSEIQAHRAAIQSRRVASHNGRIAAAPGVGGLVRSKRVSLGMTQIELAALSGVSAQKVRMIEGGVPCRGFRCMEPVLTALGLPEEGLVDG